MFIPNTKLKTKLDRCFCLLNFTNTTQGIFPTCLQVFPASEETNMLMSLSDNSEPILPRKSIFPLVERTFCAS